MKLVSKNFLVKDESLLNLEIVQKVLLEVDEAIKCVVWPTGSDCFIINPTRKGNGVKPIKNECMEYLSKCGWRLEEPIDIASRKKPGPIDAFKTIEDFSIAVEWETGNISSSHRALNKLALGLLKKIISCGILILPSGKFYPYLTDRVGNYPELEPYFEVWKSLPYENSLLMVYEIEFDKISDNVPFIGKGTDGRALR
ncbi:MAG: restriction endonuclease [bacterium]